MLLVITLRRDDNWETVTKHVTKPVVRVNLDDNPLPDISYVWDGCRFGHFLSGWDLDRVTSVWYRIGYVTYYKPPNDPYWLFNRLSREEMVKYLYGILNQAVWVSDPYAIVRAENKMFQLELAQRIGLNIPLTVVTSSPEKAEKFRREVGRIIVKPLAKQVVDVGEKVHAFFTTRITPGMEVDYRFLPNSPAIFQEEISRQCDVRVIVVGDKVFSLAIYQVRSKAGGVDYRVRVNEDLEFEPHKLPDNLEQKCVELIRRLGLKFGAIDLILGANGVYYFLENNATGSWRFVEKHGNYPISETLAQLLS